MALALAITAVTATSVTMTEAGVPGGAQLEVQLSPTPEFDFAVAPIYQLATATPFTLNGLNQDAVYYVRGRTVAAGVASDWTKPTLGFRTPQAAAQDLTVPTVMIEPTILCFPEPVLQLVSPNAKVGFPADNLLIDSPIAWRTLVNTGTTYRLDFQTAGGLVDMLALLQTNISEGATVQLLAATTQAGLDNAGTRTELIAAGTAFRASANVPGRRGYHGLWRFAATHLPWFRLLITGTITGGMLHAEHLIAGWNRSTKCHSVDKAETPSTLGSMERRRSGAIDRVQGLPVRRSEFDLSMLTETQYETTYRDLNYRINQPVLCVPNSKSGAFFHDRILYGSLVQARSVNPFSPRYTVSVAVDSIL